MLEKVKHENIVKLLAIEEEQEGRGKVSNENSQLNLKKKLRKVPGWTMVFFLAVLWVQAFFFAVFVS